MIFMYVTCVCDPRRPCLGRGRRGDTSDLPPQRHRQQHGQRQRCKHTRRVTAPAPRACSRDSQSGRVVADCTRVCAVVVAPAHISASRLPTLAAPVTRPVFGGHWAHCSCVHLPDNPSRPRRSPQRAQAPRQQGHRTKVCRVAVLVLEEGQDVRGGAAVGLPGRTDLGAQRLHSNSTHPAAPPHPQET